jgi:hypothetical protein
MEGTSAAPSSVLDRTVDISRPPSQSYRKIRRRGGNVTGRQFD